MDPENYNKRKFNDDKIIDDDNYEENGPNKSQKIEDEEDDDNFNWDDGVILGEVNEIIENKSEIKPVNDVELISDEEIKKITINDPSTISVSLNPISSSAVTTHSGIASPATFAVWNLWDLGGGFQAAHWKKNDALKNLPFEIKKIDADVFGFLEIKTGTTSPQLPKEQYHVKVFEMGAMLAWMMDKYLTDKKLYSFDKNEEKMTLKEIFENLSRVVWVGEEIDSLISGLESFGNLEKTVNIEDTNIIFEEMVSYSTNCITDWLNKKNKSISKIFYWIGEKCKNKGYANSLYKLKTGDQGLDPELKDIISAVKQTWKLVVSAFDYGGTIEIEKQVASMKEAEGIPLIKDVLKICTENSEFESVIIDPVKDDGETTAFLYNRNKFCCLQKGSIPIRGTGFSFRSAGFLFLQGKSGTLNNKNILAVAWHAPSEIHSVDRIAGYECFNKKIKSIIGKRDIEVVLLADMNIRENDLSGEEGIKKLVYENWLPPIKEHQSFKTSLKLTGTNGEQWNHPFDKVLLLNTKKDELEIQKMEKMSDRLSAKEIRIFSDHSWVKAQIIPKKTNK